MKELLMTQVLPHLFDYIITVGVGLVLLLFRRLTGLQVDATRREALQSALRNGSRLLLQPGGSIEDAIDYVLRSIPDTLRHFGIENPDEIERYLQPHIVEAKMLAAPAVKVDSAGIDRSAFDHWLREISRPDPT